MLHILILILKLACFQHGYIVFMRRSPQTSLRCLSPHFLGTCHGGGIHAKRSEMPLSFSCVGSLLLEESGTLRYNAVGMCNPR